MQTAMMDLREDLADSIVLINNRLDFLDNITDENLRNLCKVMVDTTLKGIIKRIDDELLEMEKQQIMDAHLYGQFYKSPQDEDTSEQYYNEQFEK